MACPWRDCAPHWSYLRALGPLPHNPTTRSSDAGCLTEEQVLKAIAAVYRAPWPRAERRLYARAAPSLVRHRDHRMLPPHELG